MKQDAFNLTGGRFISHFQSCLAILSMCLSNAWEETIPYIGKFLSVEIFVC